MLFTKNIFYILSLIIFTGRFILFPIEASAHMIGQPPYFKANGVYTDFYPVPSTSLSDFRLPQDIVKQSILINQPVKFEIDKTQLPVPADVVDKTKFVWDFGDGTTESGLTNTHTYLKPGTYFLDIKADSGDGFEPQLMQSTAINVLPDENYKLPKSIIEVNGRQSKDPLLDIINVNFAQEVNFNGSKSDGGSSQITKYQWDLGDQNSKTDLSFKYQYKDNPYSVFPVLRIETKDGFIADSFVQLTDDKSFNSSPASSITTNNKMDWKMIIGAILGSLGIAAVLSWLISKYFFKK